MHSRIVSFVSRHLRGVIASAWSLIDQKSSEEQKRAKSQASASGCAPSPPITGSVHRNASVEYVVWTWRSPNRICLLPPPIACAALASAAARAVTTSAGMACFANVPGPYRTPYQPSTAPAT